MKSVFSLFENYEGCKQAVDALLEADFDENEMNVLVEEEAAKAYLDVNFQDVSVRSTEALGEGARGLNVLLGVEQPVVLPTIGQVYAAGDIATILAKTAAAPEAAGLRESLKEFGIPSSMVDPIVEALTDGALLFWVRTTEQRAAEAREILEAHNETHVARGIG